MKIAAWFDVSLTVCMNITPDIYEGHAEQSYFILVRLLCQGQVLKTH